MVLEDSTTMGARIKSTLDAAISRLQRRVLASEDCRFHKYLSFLFHSLPYSSHWFGVLTDGRKLDNILWQPYLPPCLSHQPGLAGYSLVLGHEAENRRRARLDAGKAPSMETWLKIPT